MVSEEMKRLCGLSPDSEAGEEIGPFISVEHLTGRFGAMYEKVRSLVDYKEYHLIRRSAIKRIVNRQLYLEKSSQDVGIALLRDLVSSGYLPNNKVPEAKSTPLLQIIRKWTFLGKGGLATSLSLDFAAIEIERFLYPDRVTELVVDSFFRSSEPFVLYQDRSIKNQSLITYAACRRSFLSEDQSGLLYALLLFLVPEVVRNDVNDEKLSRISSQVSFALKTAESVTLNQLVWTVSTRLKNHSLYHAVLLEILRSYGKGAELVFEDEEKLREISRGIIEKKQSQQKSILRKSGKRAVIYLLLTKIALGLLLEFPYEYFILSSVSYFALGTNAVFHPALLLSMVMFVGSGKRGVERVIDGVSAVVHGKEMKRVFIRPPGSSTTFFFVACFYVLLFVASFGAILWALVALHFNVVSILLFFVFLTLVSYFGLRIRRGARRWEPDRTKPSTFGLVWNLFVFPIVQTGRWFSIRFASINVFVLFLDFLVEVPFKAFLGIFDASLSFIKEHRVETY
ncbi:MAG TPA: hypothetical protein DEP25_02650 [Candidatus Taylorbacteria bacterium]|nr:hypothetical protein [Candidatus Taylorbacteria bacterium]